MATRTKIPVELVTNLTDQELEHVVELHIKAYSGSEYYEGVLAGDWSLFPTQARAFYRGALLGGLIYAVRAPEGGPMSGQIVALGIFFKPGTGVFATEAQRSLGYNQWLASLKPELQTWHTTVVSVLRLAGQQKQIAKANLDFVSSLRTIAKLSWNRCTPMRQERARRWWCSGLLTDPEFQGKGYAKAIMNTVFEKVCETDGFLGLATSAPLHGAKYEAMGFTARGAYQLPTPLGEMELTLYDRIQNA
ncbi:hypothetical protein AAF712_012636 [Marasmius tenuissimus]|uniref:N-acetyltransferase domain-containing protein n=1 Tax=Marasmius tenuissimus TaxID=585030 RepID=A0ABR2ZGV3_9AGAR